MYVDIDRYSYSTDPHDLGQLLFLASADSHNQSTPQRSIRPRKYSSLPPATMKMTSRRPLFKKCLDNVFSKLVLACIRTSPITTI